MTFVGPRQAAFARLGGTVDVRVLEPSPPAVDVAPWFADDPVAGGEVVPLDRVGSESWLSRCVASGDPELAAWCEERWLGPWPHLQPLPADFASTRLALHTVAEHVLAPARHAATGKIGLRFTKGGFGTPFFDADRQVRVAGTELVCRRGPDADDERSTSLTTLWAAAEAAGVPPGAGTGVFRPTTSGDPDAVLAVEPRAAEAVGAWFGFCTSVLEQIRAESTDASRVQLWPEHFDVAVDLGDEAAGARANYGGSTGDADHPEPYLYVGPWSPRTGSFWTESFGAVLSYQKLLMAEDQRATALQFLRTGRRLLHDG